MIATKWEHIKDLFEAALNNSEQERHSSLARLQTEDPEVAAELIKLLRSYEEAGDFLVHPCTLAADFLEDLEVEQHRFCPHDVLCGRFRIVHLIGQGGMGEVYKAWDEELEDYVALKTLRLEVSAHELFTSRFRREIQLARKVTHPNVCRIFDSFKHPAGDGYISVLSMELLQGQTLAEYLKDKGRLTVLEAAPIVQQITSGLAAIHAAGIVHRDLKPSNMVMTPRPTVDQPYAHHGSSNLSAKTSNESGENNDPSSTGFQIKITDFGIAGQIRDGLAATAQSEASKFLGTPDYMAPEQLEHGRTSIQSDIYSLGLILYMMVTGVKPFASSNAWTRTVSRVPDPRHMVPGISSSWKHTILCCLEKDPARRPSSVASVMALFNTPPPRKWPTYVAAAIIFVLLTVFGVLMWRPHPINPDAQLAVDIARRAIENPSEEGFNKAFEEYKRAIALDPKWATPWAELAYAYAAASNARYLDGRTALVSARKVALQAIEIDPYLAKAHGALAWTESLDFDEWPRAEDAFRTALRLDPEDGRIHYWFGVHLRKKGRFKEAEYHDQLAIRLTHGNDPNIWDELGFLYWTSAQTLKFNDHMQEQLKTFPNFPLTRFLYARLLKLQGHYEQAAEELSFAEKLKLNPLTVMVERASLEEYKGDTEAARRDIAQIVEASHTKEIDGLLLAGDYVGLGENDAAFNLLEAAFQRKDNTLLSLATSPVIAPLRQDPRYISLLRRLHFTDQIMQQIGFN